MIYESIISEFENSDFEYQNDFVDKKIEVYKNKRSMKTVVLQRYFTETQLKEWEKGVKDILGIFTQLKGKERYNFYYILILEKEEKISKVSKLIINEIERNDEICKKIVIYKIEDIERIPFLEKGIQKKINFKINFTEKIVEKIIKNDLFLQDFKTTVNNFKALKK